MKITQRETRGQRPVFTADPRGIGETGASSGGDFFMCVVCIIQREGIKRWGINLNFRIFTFASLIKFENLTKFVN